MIRLADTGGGTPLYRVKITLRDCKPPIWRRVVVRADMKLDRLHRVIQIAMGWTDSHLHQFIAGGAYYGQPDPEGDAEMLNEKRYTVTDLAPGAKQKFTYEYDFGDSWEHEVLVEEVLPPDPDSNIRSVWAEPTPAHQRTAAEAPVTPNLWTRWLIQSTSSTRK